MSFKKSCGKLGELIGVIIDITIKCFQKFYVDICKVFFEELAKVIIDRIKKDVWSITRRLLTYSSFFFLTPFDFNSDTVMVSECSNRILADMLLSFT